MLAVAFMLGLHGGDGGIVENLDDAAAEALLQFVGAIGLSLRAEVGDVELKLGAQDVAYLLLLKARAGAFAAEQLADDVDFVLGELVASHGW